LKPKQKDQNRMRK